MPPTDLTTARRRRLVTRAVVALVLVAGGAGTFVACSDTPLGPGRSAPALASGDQTPGAADHAKGSDGIVDVSWVGTTHNTAMRALTGELAAKLAGSSASERCAAVRAAVEAYAAQGRLRDGQSQPISVQGEVAQALAASDGHGLCNTPVTDKLPFSAQLRQLTEGRLSDYHPSADALALADQMEQLALGATSADGFSSALVPLEQQANALPSALDRELLLGAASTGRASAYNVEQNPPPPPPGTPPELEQGIGRAGWRERMREISRADIRGCVVGGIMGGLTSGGSGILAGCAVGGVTSSVEKAVDLMQ